MTTENIVISRGIIADVQYFADGIDKFAEVEFDALPRLGDPVWFHGDGMDYLYRVRDVTWHLHPGPEFDTGRVVVNVGPCVDRKQVGAK